MPLPSEAANAGEGRHDLVLAVFDHSLDRRGGVRRRRAIFLVLFTLLLLPFPAVLAVIFGVGQVSANGSTDLEKRNGCLTAVVGAIVFLVFVSMADALRKNAFATIAWCNQMGSSDLMGFFYRSGELVDLDGSCGSSMAAGSLLLAIGVLRSEQFVKYAVFKVGYRCPKCHERGLPQFRCPGCKDLIRDLRPSIHGIWTARCDCGRVLPTTDLGGRLRLEKVCQNPKCRRRLQG